MPCDALGLFVADVVGEGQAGQEDMIVGVAPDLVAAGADQDRSPSASSRAE